VGWTGMRLCGFRQRGRRRRRRLPSRNGRDEPIGTRVLFEKYGGLYLNILIVTVNHV
jgi:hypothetical protein